MQTPPADTPSLASERGERRRLPDRRRSPTTFRSLLRPGGRRRGFRRQGEGRNRYLDQVSRPTSALVLFILLACALDALFTLLHMQGGAREINPLMGLALSRGLTPFVGVKILSTALGLLFLAAHEGFTASRVALRAVASAYALLLGYHALLFL